MVLKAASIQGEAAHKGGTSKWLRQHQQEDTRTPINNQKTVYGWLGKTFRVSGRLNKQG
jgi:hypothetical protein